MEITLVEWLRSEERKPDGIVNKPPLTKSAKLSLPIGGGSTWLSLLIILGRFLHTRMTCEI